MVELEDDDIGPGMECHNISADYPDSDLGDLINETDIAYLQGFDNADNALESPKEDLDSQESNPDEYYDDEYYDEYYDSDEDVQLPDRITYTIRDPDPLCSKLDDLLSRGLIPSDGILYRHLNDVVECVYDPMHEYHTDVKEFFNTIQHLGGNSTVHFIQGPMYIGSGKKGVCKSRDRTDCNMNWAGPSATTRSKKKSGYTTKSGIVKELTLAHYKLSRAGENPTLVSNDLVQVFPCVLSNDGNPLKPGIEFNKRYKRNIGVDVTIDYNFIQNNKSQDPEFLKERLVTDIDISSITTLNNKQIYHILLLNITIYSPEMCDIHRGEAVKLWIH